MRLADGSDAVVRSIAFPLLLVMLWLAAQLASLGRDGKAQSQCRPDKTNAQVSVSRLGVTDTSYVNIGSKVPQRLTWKMSLAGKGPCAPTDVTLTDDNAIVRQPI